MNKINSTFLLVTILGICLWVVAKLNSPAVDSNILFLSGYTMGTQYQVQVVALANNTFQAELGSQIQSKLKRLDLDIMSTYAKGSELSRFNQSSINQPHRVSLELIDVIALSQSVFELTNHAFDMTVAPLVNLWGFGNQGARPVGSVPTDGEIEQALNMLGSSSIQYDEEVSSLIKTASVQIDLSGIAKGYAVDQIADLLDEYGLTAYLVEIGGELRLKGTKPGGESWVLGIEAPEAGLTQVFEHFYAKGASLAIAGSGDYRNYFEANGEHYSHEIDPTTGRPITHHLAAVTVVADSAAFADAYATALMIMGPALAYEHASNINVAAYFIVRSGSEFVSQHTANFEPFLSP